MKIRCSHMVQFHRCCVYVCVAFFHEGQQQQECMYDVLYVVAGPRQFLWGSRGAVP